MSQFKEEMEMNQVIVEKTDISNCPICFDEITLNKNSCLTPCGHAFCFNCMVKSLNNSNMCPYCRALINDKPIRDDDDEEEYDDDYETLTDDDDEDDDEDDENENENGNSSTNQQENADDEDEYECSIERVESYFKEKGITYTNLLSVMFSRFPQDMSRRSRKQLNKKIYDMIDFLDEEHINCNDENELMKENDIPV